MSDYGDYGDDIDYDPDGIIVDENYDGDNGINFEDMFLQARGDVNLYRELISLEKDNSTGFQWGYQSYEQICYILMNEKNMNELKENMSCLFNLYQNVDDIYRQDTVRNLCSAVNNLKDDEFGLEAISSILQILKEKEISREVTNAGLYYARKLMELNRVEELGEVVDDLLNYMLMIEDFNEIHKSTKLELLVMKIHYCNSKNLFKECRKVYYEAFELNKDIIIEEFKLSAIIYEQGGKLDMKLKNFEGALEKFKNSFTNYQKCGENLKAKIIMKYEILCSIIVRSKNTFFSAEEAKPYRDDAQLLAILDLYEAYEQMDIDLINKIWNERISKLETDEYILDNINEIYHNIRFNYVVEKLKAFKICRFETLEKVYYINIGTWHR
jgi:COP9 signalosome complex subunit 2